MSMLSPNKSHQHEVSHTHWTRRKEESVYLFEIYCKVLNTTLSNARKRYRKQVI